MNTRDKAYDQLSAFLKSEDKGLLITGTHQFEKHPLVLQAIANEIYTPSSILFRANSMSNLGTIFKNHGANFQTGTGYKLGNHKIYLDTINRTSWTKTKWEYDFAILYPIDALMRDKKLYNKILDDLFEDRRINKIFLVSWTDNSSYDFEQLKKDGYVHKHVVFDAEEENPAYHKRMLK